MVGPNLMSATDNTGNVGPWELLELFSWIQNTVTHDFKTSVSGMFVMCLFFNKGFQII
jgi:hypothetical protein